MLAAHGKRQAARGSFGNGTTYQFWLEKAMEKRVYRCSLCVCNEGEERPAERE